MGLGVEWREEVAALFKGYEAFWHWEFLIWSVHKSVLAKNWRILVQNYKL